ncbi:hypothetical protein AC578_2291 [Pseudocercospora eumusae]|uniref:Uncharacterized protein n=1 Tax=Pseudocercospora eumusae TaxID=321146 RepID=A0A139H0T5_9PEZI|nr:hypothetical protein AC578_2291 [Pseudocercospora eumusae]
MESGQSRNARKATQLMTDELGKHTAKASARRLASVERRISEVVGSTAQLDLIVGRVTFQGAQRDGCRQIMVSAVRLRREAAQAGMEVQSIAAKRAKKKT